MSFHYIVVTAITLLVLSYVAYIGGLPERLVAAILASRFIADPLYGLLVGPPVYIVLDVGRMVMDGLAFVALFWIAMRANRAWPLWVVAAQLLVMTGHAVMFFEIGGMQRAYWAMTQLPFFVQLLAILLGAIAHRRRLAELGPYRDWRAS